MLDVDKDPMFLSSFEEGLVVCEGLDGRFGD
jgi:hypothetical protein